MSRNVWKKFEKKDNPILKKLLHLPNVLWEVLWTLAYFGRNFCSRNALHLNSRPSREYLKSPRHHRKRFVVLLLTPVPSHRWQRYVCPSILVAQLISSLSYISCVDVYVRDVYVRAYANIQNLMSFVTIQRSISSFNSSDYERANWSQYVSQSNRVTCIRGKIYQTDRIPHIEETHWERVQVSN